MPWKQVIKQRFLKGAIILKCLIGPTNSLFPYLMSHQSHGHMDQSRCHHLRTQTTIAYSRSKLVHLSKGQCNKGAHVYSNFTWKSGFFLKHWNLRPEKKHFLPGRNHHLTFKKMGEELWHLFKLGKKKRCMTIAGKAFKFSSWATMATTPDDKIQGGGRGG